MNSLKEYFFRTKLWIAYKLYYARIHIFHTWAENVVFEYEANIDTCCLTPSDVDEDLF